MSAGGQNNLRADVDAIKARLLLSTLIARNVKLDKMGNDYFAPCPFHEENTASFTVNDNGGFFHCFGCGANGDAIDWMQKYHGMTFGEAMRSLKLDAGVVEHNAEQREKDRKILKERKERQAQEAKEKKVKGVGLWHSGVGSDDSPLQSYLMRRGIDLNKFPRLPGALRYRGDVRHPYIKQDFPAMLCCYVTAKAKLVACHQTFLQYREGWNKLKVLDPVATKKRGFDCWHKNKLSLGLYKGCHLPIWKGEFDCPLRDIPAGTPVYVSEGIEDGLTIAIRDMKRRVIGAGALGNLGSLILPPQAGPLIFIAQRDPEGGKQEEQFHAAIGKQQQRAIDDGSNRLVQAIWPQEGFKDFNEEWMDYLGLDPL